MINQLTIRQGFDPSRRCKHEAYSGEYDCDRFAEFYFDAPGEIARDLCHYHAIKDVPDLLNRMHAEALRDYDQQTTRLRQLGKPCSICGVRREEHPARLGRVYNEGLSFVVDHNWTDDEDTAEAWERDHPRVQLIKDTDHK